MYPSSTGGEISKMRRVRYSSFSREIAEKCLKCSQKRGVCLCFCRRVISGFTGARNGETDAHELSCGSPCATNGIMGNGWETEVENFIPMRASFFVLKCHQIRSHDFGM